MTRSIPPHLSGTLKNLSYSQAKAHTTWHDLRSGVSSLRTKPPRIKRRVISETVSIARNANWSRSNPGFRFSLPSSTSSSRKQKIRSNTPLNHRHNHHHRTFNLTKLPLAAVVSGRKGERSCVARTPPPFLPIIVSSKILNFKNKLIAIKLAMSIRELRSSSVSVNLFTFCVFLSCFPGNFSLFSRETNRSRGFECDAVSGEIDLL